VAIDITSDGNMRVSQRFRTEHSPGRIGPQPDSNVGAGLVYFNA
jgi:hypothetical protein